MRWLVRASSPLALAVAVTACADFAVASPVPTVSDGALSGRITVTASQNQSVDIQHVAGRQQGFFSRIMELERRKNAWLRGLFR